MINLLKSAGLVSGSDSNYNGLVVQWAGSTAIFLKLHQAESKLESGPLRAKELASGSEIAALHIRVVAILAGWETPREEAIHLQQKEGQFQLIRYCGGKSRQTSLWGLQLNKPTWRGFIRKAHVMSCSRHISAGSLNVVVVAVTATSASSDPRSRPT